MGRARAAATGILSHEPCDIPHLRLFPTAPAAPADDPPWSRPREVDPRGPSLSRPASLHLQPAPGRCVDGHRLALPDGPRGAACCTSTAVPSPPPHHPRHHICAGLLLLVPFPHQVGTHPIETRQFTLMISLTHVPRHPNSSPGIRNNMRKASLHARVLWNTAPVMRSSSGQPGSRIPRLWTRSRLSHPHLHSTMPAPRPPPSHRMKTRQSARAAPSHAQYSGCIFPFSIQTFAS